MNSWTTAGDRRALAGLTPTHHPAAAAVQEASLIDEMSRNHEREGDYGLPEDAEVNTPHEMDSVRRHLRRRNEALENDRLWTPKIFRRLGEHHASVRKAYREAHGLDKPAGDDD